jgi:hypothetical protein
LENEAAARPNKIRSKEKTKKRNPELKSGFLLLVDS